MRVASIVAVCAVCAMNSFAADPHWIRIQSPDFEIYSTAGERSTRDTLKQFEQVRAFFVSNLPTKDTKPLPVRIVQFSSDKEYLPYRFNEFATAYYRPGAERDTIVMSHGGQENFPTAIHEYTHLVVRHAGLNLPPWLNEGLAEVYSTLQQVGGKMVVGQAIPGRILEIRQSKWVPLSIILSVGQDSPYYNEKNKAGSFYDEAWALTHMLSFSNEYGSKWGQFVLAIADGKESIEALTSIYGKPLAQIEEDLRGYVERDRFSAGIMDAKFEKIDAQYAPEPAPAFEVKLMLLELAANLTNEQKQEQLKMLAAEQPSRPEPHVQLGYLLWSSGRPSSGEVKAEFAKAYELGGRSPRMLWDYGRMLIAAQPADAVQVLGDLAALEPERRDVTIERAGAMLNAGRPSDALQGILSLKGCTPSEGPQCVSIAAYSYLRMNQREKAHETAQLYLKVAKTPEDRQRAQALIDATQPRPEPPAPKLRAAAPQLRDPEAPPAIERRPRIEEPPTVRYTPRKVDTVSGKFVEFACEPEKALVIDTGSEKKRFVIDQPNNITITGRDGISMDLYCGPQKPALAVQLGYVQPPVGSKADGAVRTLKFGP